jgi:predicted O-linked N-acetylglucosamine transferase (SPINDLY family)
MTDTTTSQAGPSPSAEQAFQQALQHTLQQGVSCHQAGQTHEAEHLYRAILQAQPQHPVANHNLGILMLEKQQPAAGLPHFEAALAAEPESERYWLSYIDALVRAGQEDLAQRVLALGRQHGLQGNVVEALAEKLKVGQHATELSGAEQKRSIEATPAEAVIAVAKKGKSAKKGKCPPKMPRSPKSLPQGERNQLVALFNAGRYAELESRVHFLLEQYPHSGFVWNVLGTSLQVQGKESLPALQKAAELLPDYAEVHSNLGNALQNLRRLDDAVASYRRALEIKPDFAVAHNNLGIALQDLGRLDDAVASYRRALEIKPDYAEAHSNLGNVLQNLRRLDDAVASFHRALEIKPDYAVAHSNLGNALQDLGRFDDAVASYRRALEIKPDFVDAHNNLGNALRELGQLDYAAASYRRALEIKPDFAVAHSNLLFIHNHQSDLPPAILLAEARRFGNLVARQARAYTHWRNVPESGRCLRVGLVSGDLRDHPVCYFVEGMLAALASNASGLLKFIGYPSHFRTDALTQRIKACCQGWRSAVGLSDESLARLIRDDGIDILIDLSGHTAHNRLPIFAWKPAPVQASWLGYFATTGVAAIDYLIADPWTAPEAEETHFTEKIQRLPETYLCFTPPDVDVQVAPLPAFANGYITFGCFNNLSKMNDGVVALWARVLQAVPGSRLFLKTKQLNEAIVRQSVVERFAIHGIDAGRLILEGPAPRADLLTAYRRVDIALDPFPYTGGTTSVEALWMGVPVLTLAGDRFLSHTGESKLQNAGLPEWIASDADDYVALAVSHASDLQRLATLRNGLRQQVLASPLFDAPRFARHFEAALRGMWTQWCNQQQAKPS